MITKFTTRIILGLLTFVIVGLLPFGEAFASASTTLLAQTKTLAVQSSNIPKLIAVLCYVVGVFYTVRALLGLKNYISNPEENPINSFIGYGAIGALLIVLPYSIVIVAETFAMKFPTVESSQKTFENEAQYGQSSTASMEGMFANLSSNFIPIAKTLAILAYVMATVIMLIGLINLKEYGDDPSKVPIRSIIMKFVLAAMLVSLPFAMQIFVTTVTGRAGIEDQETVGMPCLMSGSGLSGLRAGSAKTACK